MHFRFCLKTAQLLIMVAMRFFPIVILASLLCWLAPAPAWAQRLDCAPCYYAFGQVQIGNPSSYSFQLSNPGRKTLRISSMTKPGGAFSVVNFPLPVNIQPGATVALTVVFTPTAKGYAAGALTLTSNARSAPKIHVHGTGTSISGASLVVTPATLNFGNVTVGSSSSLPAKLTASNAAVTISSDGSTSSEFAIVGLSLPKTLQPGQSIPVTIQFTPNASGTASGKAGFTSNAVNSPTVEQLTGTGVAKGSHTVDLTWNQGDGNAVGYNLYRGTAKGGPFAQINTALDASTNYTDSTVVSGTTYYYVATEVDAQGQESAYSNVTTAVVPNP
jgi:hypothetical protein